MRLLNNTIRDRRDITAIWSRGSNGTDSDHDGGVSVRHPTVFITWYSMTNSGIPSLDAKLAISRDYIAPAHRIRGERTQRDKIWERFSTRDETYCVICNRQIARKPRAKQEGLQHGEFHHLIKRRYFPSPYEIHQGKYSEEERKSKHHLSNGLLVCKPCHGRIENYANGRPHIMSWLARSITGAEIPVVLPSDSQVRDSQRRDWNQIQKEIERRESYRCEACGYRQQRRVRKQVYDGTEVLFDYIGRDVRAVHILPPYVAPKLMHDPVNLILLC